MAYSVKIYGSVVITIEREKMYSFPYKSVVLHLKFFADFVVFNQVILEIKAKDGIVPEDMAQTLKGLFSQYQRDSLSRKSNPISRGSGARFVLGA